MLPNLSPHLAAQHAPLKAALIDLVRIPSVCDEEAGGYPFGPAVDQALRKALQIAADQIGELIDHIRQPERGGLDGKLPRLDLGEIQNFVDDAEQILAGEKEDGDDSDEAGAEE